MKVKVEERSSTDGDGDRISVSVDGRPVFSIGSGEPEDMSLGRDLNDAYSVPKLLEKAHAAGKAGEPFEMEWFTNGELKKAN